jgi:hypothetical protein
MYLVAAKKLHVPLAMADQKLENVARKMQIEIFPIKT